MVRTRPGNAVPLGNAVEMQMNQGKFKEAAANIEKLRPLSISYGTSRRSMLLVLTGEYAAQKALGDSLAATPAAANVTRQIRRGTALREGRLKDLHRLDGSPKLADDGGYAVTRSEWALLVKGRSPAIGATLDSVVAIARFADAAMVEQG